MLKKYLIFISSSQEDLRAERRELIRIVTELGAIPVTMDGFDITQEDDSRLIFKTIGECDYFLNLTAYKGGEAVGKSFALEVEYSAAIKAEIPVLALIIDKKARWKDTKKEKNADAVKALENFKKTLESHSFETWAGLVDLRQKALCLLIREMNLNPRQGWISGDLAADQPVANELCRLIRENNSLKHQIKMGGANIIRRVREQMRHTLKMLSQSRISLSFYYVNGQTWENSKPFRYLRLFRLLAPELNIPKTASEISRFLGNILNPDLEKTVRKDFPVPSNTIKKIMADFSALDLVKCTETPSKDDEVWDLTEYGKETYTIYRLRHMESKLTQKIDSTKS